MAVKSHWMVRTWLSPNPRKPVR